MAMQARKRRFYLEILMGHVVTSSCTWVFAEVCPLWNIENEARGPSAKA